MTWQIIIYLSSLLFTCALTGFLAWYAWKHHQMPGTHTYAALALAECLLALTELLSVLNAPGGGALFWFQIRYIIIAFVAVFWLIFAIEYSGHREWISKRLLAGLFVIPLVTQVLHWSNNLHGLWMKQEAGFTQNGPLWIADVTARLPGAGYLTHSFYTLLLTLVGITLMFMTAWRMRREFIGQALLLAGAGLTAFIFAANSIFRLLPKTEFNLFTPGIGLSMFLIAVAVFRFDFLKRAPVIREGVPQGNRLDAQERNSLVIFILIFILFTSGIAAAGTLTYQNYEKQFRAQVEEQLSAIAELKVNGLENWRFERMADAEVLHKNPTFAALIQKFLENSEDAQAKAQLQTWLDTIRDSYDYNRVFLLDSQGVERVSSPAMPETIPAELVDQVSASLASEQVVFLDFHRHTGESAVHLSLLIPIFDPQDNRPLGVVVLRIDPNDYLYPFIQRWPVPSESAETLLVRRDGEDALFLNPLRFQPNTPLNLRFSLTDTQLPAAKAVLGGTGAVEGLDYRDVLVIADIRNVPDSPWFLVSKVDTAEVYAPLRARLWQTILFFGALALATGAGLMFVWRQQRVRFYRKQVEAARALRASEEKFRLAFETSPDSFTITRLSDGMFVSVNHGFTQTLGYAKEEVIGRTSLKINIWENPQDRQRIVAGLQTEGVVENFEASFRTKRGEIRYGLMSASVIELNGEPHILNITRDITERKLAEEALRESEKKYRHLINGMSDTVCVIDFDTAILDVNNAAIEVLGYTREELLSMKIHHIDDSLSPEQIENLVGNMPKDKTQVFETWHITKDGRKLPVEISSSLVSYKGKNAIMSIARDITERKQAENALRESEAFTKTVLDNLPVGIAVNSVDPPVTFSYMNENFVRFYRTTKEKLADPDAFWSAVYEEPDFREEMKKRVLDDMASGDPRRMVWEDFPITRKGQGTRYITAKNIPIPGKPLVISTVWDVTERKQAEERLREGEERLRLSLRAANQGMYDLNVQTGAAIVNEEYALMLGYDPETFVESNAAWIERLHPDDKDITAKAYTDYTNGVTSEYRVEFRQKTKNGDWKWILSLGKVVEFDAAGKPLRMLGTHTDITEHKQVEQALNVAQHLMNALMDNVPVQIYFKDRESRFIRINNTLAKLFGLSDPKQAIGKSDFDFFTDGHAQQAYEDEQAVIETGQPIRKEEIETWNNLPDSWVSTVKLPLRDKDGKIIGTFGISMNITERKQAEKVLEEYNTRLEAEVEQRTRELRETQEQLVRQERLATLGQLAGSIGHELRNPLGIISNAVYYLKSAESNFTDKVREYLDIIEKETRTSAKIVTDLLDFTRIKSIDRQLVSVPELIWKTLQLNPAPPSIEVALELPPDLPGIYVDPQQIIQVLGNLVTNAFQSMTGAVPLVEPKLIVSASAQNDMLSIAVRDTGPGISPENMGKIFQPLFTTKTKGIGLGLAVSQKLAGANGGRIEVESELGKGSVFTIYLPTDQKEIL